MRDPSVLLMAGDAEARLRELPSEFVNTIVTSPPYFRLRKYGAGAAEIGQETTPEAYAERLVEVFREVRRVLRPDGTCWIVIGDRFKDKDLLLLPALVAMALRADGWILRKDIIWAKTNAFPESCIDRPTSSHEHILMLAKGAAYFYDQFAIRESESPDTAARYSYGFGEPKNTQLGVTDKRTAVIGHRSPASGRNARDVWAAYDDPEGDLWNIKVEPSHQAHFAIFPTRLASRAIAAATPEGGCCGACGTPLCRVLADAGPDEAHMRACGADRSGGYAGEAVKDYASAGAQEASATKRRILAGMRKRVTVGWRRTCGCGEAAGTVPALVLDPFSGAGTSLLCAARLGRDAIGIDLVPEYHVLARTRITDLYVKCLDGRGERLPYKVANVQEWDGDGMVEAKAA